MKKVDSNYSYDELEGFIPLEIRSLAPQDEILLSMYRGKLNLSKAARTILFVKDYLLIAYNSEQRQLLLAACPEAGKGTIRLPKSAAGAITNKALDELLTRECRYDMAVARIYIRGTVCRSRAGAIIFDLNTVTSKKARRKAKS